MKRNKNDNSSNLEALDNLSIDLDYGIDEVGVSKSWMKILHIKSANYEGLVLSTKATSLHSVAIMIICKDNA